jgi:hypothetical protein
LYTLAGGAAVEPPRGNSLDAGRKADLQLWRKQYRKYSKQEKESFGAYINAEAQTRWGWHKQNGQNGFL